MEPSAKSFLGFGFQPSAALRASGSWPDADGNRLIGLLDTAVSRLRVPNMGRVMQEVLSDIATTRPCRDGTRRDRRPSTPQTDTAELPDQPHRPGA